MKLHLPKMLLTAVLTACVANTTWAEWDTKNTDTFYMDSTTVAELSTVGREQGSNGFFVRTNNNDAYVNSSITTLTLDDAHVLNIDGSWNDSTKEFNTLTVDTVAVSTGTGTIHISLSNSVNIGAIEGTLNVRSEGNVTFNQAAEINDVTIYNGSITFAGAEGTEYSVQKVAMDDTKVAGQLFTDTITVNTGVKVTAEQVNNGWGLGALTVNGILEVNGNLSYGTGDNGNTGNVINGTGSIIAGTFDVGNVTKAVLDIEEFQATNLKQGVTNEWGSSLTIKSGRVAFDNSEVKTLTIEGGEVALGQTTLRSNGVLNISGGAVTIGNSNLSSGRVNITGGSLDLTGNVTLGSSLELSGDAVLDLGTGNTITLSSLDGFTQTAVVNTGSVSSDQNGFAVVDKVYEIISGATDSRVQGSAIYKYNDQEISVVNGLYTVAGTTLSTTYLINIGSVNTSSDEVAGATAFYVQSHAGQDAGTLVIDTHDNAAALLTGTQGNGDIQLSTGSEIVMANGTSTLATGSLIISAGTTLKAGEGTTQHVSTSSFTSVVLAGGKLYAHNNGIILNNLSTTADSVIHIQDMQAQTSEVILAGTTVLNDDLQVTSGFKGTLKIEKLTGTGNLDVNVGDNAYDDALKVAINGIEQYSGIISYEGSEQPNNAITINNTSAGFSVGGFELTEGAKASVYTGGDVTLGAGIIDNSTITLKRSNDSYAVNYSSLAVSGTATIETADGTNGNNSWQAVVNIGSLTGTDAVLKLRSGSNSSIATVFRLNGGQGSAYSGAIEVGGYNTGSNRKAVLSISDATVAQNAEIKFNAETDTNTAYLAIGADSVTLKGISDIAGNAEIVSADIKTGSDTISSDGTQRTMVLNTQGGTYTTAATLRSGLNISKKGEGSQTFSGNTDDFSGSLSVEAGSLAFTGTEALNAKDLEIAAGSVLTVGANGNGTISVGSAAVTVEETATGYAAAFEGGATIKGNLDLTNTTSLTLNALDSAVSIDGGLTLSTGTMSLAGDVLTALTGLTEGGKLNLFTVSGAFTLNGEAITALTEEDATLLSTVFNNSDLSDYYLGYENNTVYAGLVTPDAPVIDPTVPEPTTATLSLLALAALAARRRRK